MFGHFGFQDGAVGDVGRVGDDEGRPGRRVRGEQPGSVTSACISSTGGACGVSVGRRPAHRSESSTAMTRASGQYLRQAQRQRAGTGAQVDDHRTPATSGWATAHSSSASVSGRGMNAHRARRARSPGPNARGAGECAAAVSAATRCGDELVVALAESGVRCRRRHSRPRSVPAAWAARSSASARGDPTPASASADRRHRSLESHAAHGLAVMPAAAWTACRRRPARRTARRGRRRATWSRLCALKLIRWSAMRFSGKL